MSAEEANAPFLHDVTLETHTAIHDEVLRRWNHRCAVTGDQYRSTKRPHPHLELIAIRPLHLGGPLHASNFLPMVKAAATAFTDFRIIVADDFEIWTGMTWIGSHILEKFVPVGKLKLPRRQDRWPDRASLKWHRDRALGGGNT